MSNPHPTPRDRLAILSNVVFIAVALVLLAGYVRREFLEDQSEEGLTDNARVREVADWTRFAAVGHRIGSQAARVVIVEFADFQCPACRAFATSGLRAIRAEFGDTVAVIFRHWPLSYHEMAYPAARAAECAAAQGKFKEFHDAIYAGQESLRTRPFSDFARSAGVPDSVAFDACIENTSAVPVIDADVRAALDVRLEGTPSLLINGKLLLGGQDSAALAGHIRKAIMDEAH